MIIPIYSQLITLSFPSGFVPVLQNTQGDNFIAEFVPKGETAKQWTEMVTVTGAKGIATNPKISPKILVNSIAGSISKSCPETFSAGDGGGALIDGYESHIVIAGCGYSGPTDSPRSEMAVIIAIKGAQDYYTIQWSERGGASRQPIAIDTSKWGERLRKFSPIRLCPVVPGEAMPYPSCSNRK